MYVAGKVFTRYVLVTCQGCEIRSSGRSFVVVFFSFCGADATGRSSPLVWLWCGVSTHRGGLVPRVYTGWSDKTSGVRCNPANVCYIMQIVRSPTRQQELGHILLQIQIRDLSLP